MLNQQLYTTTPRLRSLSLKAGSPSDPMRVLWLQSIWGVVFEDADLGILLNRAAIPGPAMVKVLDTGTSTIESHRSYHSGLYISGYIHMFPHLSVLRSTTEVAKAIELSHAHAAAKHCIYSPIAQERA